MKKNGYRKGVPGGQITFGNFCLKSFFMCVVMNKWNNLFLGGLDTENCNSNVEYVPLSSATYWQFYVSSLTVNDGATFSSGYEVISDTGL